MSDVQARHDRMVGLVETMLKLHGDGSRLPADSLRSAYRGHAAGDSGRAEAS